MSHTLQPCQPVWPPHGGRKLRNRVNLAIIEAMAKSEKPAVTLDEVKAAAEASRAADEQANQAAIALSKALHDGHESGLTWAALAEAAGLKSTENARFRAYRGRGADGLPPSIVHRFGPGGYKRRSEDQIEKPPGLNVSEAAKVLGISRQALYKRIEAGKVNTTTDSVGRTRVLLDD